MDNKTTNFLIYETPNDKVSVRVILKDENIWLTQKSMANLFDVVENNITYHLKNIFNNNELDENSVTQKIRVTASDGKIYNTSFYNLDAIIAVGYRVNSKKATQFRIWATSVLKDYIIKGYKLDKERLKNGSKFGKDYFDELLTEIKEIRTSEYRVYKKILDIFEVTSVDYNRDSDEAYTFFKIVQNKLHYAITGKTAAELIFERVDSTKNHMGLTTWKKAPKGKIQKYDVSIAKNYLNKEELKKLENLTEMFLITAENETIENHILTMKDWIEITNDLLKYRKKSILQSNEKITHKKAIDKAYFEYEIFKIKQDSEYISSMEDLYIKYFKESKK